MRYIEDRVPDGDRARPAAPRRDAFIMMLAFPARERESLS
jgi:hypothetical protein